MSSAPTTVVLAATMALSLAGAPAAETWPGGAAPGCEQPGLDPDRALADAERELRRLEKRLDGIAAEGRARLAAKRRLVERRLAEMRGRSERAWRALRPELERALEELRKALREPAPAPDVTRT